MIGPELVAARTALQVTPEQFAAELGVTPHVYEAWEQGRIAMPKRQQQHVVFRLAIVERRAALATSGLAECEWVRGWQRAPEPEQLHARAAHVESLRAHMAHCPTCLAREQFVFERFGPMPEMSPPGWAGALLQVKKRVEQLPEWAQPAAWGALLVGSWTVLRIVLSLVREPASTTAPVVTLAISMAAGAVGGFAYHIIGRHLRNVAVVGPYLAGFVSVFAYLIVLNAAVSLTVGSALAGAPSLSVTLITSAVLGAFLGYMLFRHER